MLQRPSQLLQPQQPLHQSRGLCWHCWSLHLIEILLMLAGWRPKPAHQSFGLNM
jgi:hypothetical protein